MSQLILYSEIDTAIQRRMAGQEPDENRRLEAINDAMAQLYAEFDISTGKRELTVDLVPNGKAVLLSNFMDDFKKPADLRYLNQSDHFREYVLREDDEFMVNIGRQAALDEYAIDYRDGDLFIKTNSANGVTSAQLHGMGDLDVDGTWASDTTGSDATTLAETETLSLTQATSLTFDIDVSQSANNYALIQNSDMEATDLSDYQDIGRIQFWIKLPSVTNFTNVEVRWGSSASVYWSGTATTQADGSALVAGWNYVEIDWADATETGSVDEDNIDYLAVILNYAAGYTDQTNVVIEALTMYMPISYRFIYYTYYNSQTTAGVFQEDLTTTATDELLMPRRYKELVILKALQILAPMSLGDDAERQAAIWRNKEVKEVAMLQGDIGKRPRVAVRKVKLREQY